MEEFPGPQAPRRGGRRERKLHLSFETGATGVSVPKEERKMGRGGGKSHGAVGVLVPTKDIFISGRSVLRKREDEAKLVGAACWFLPRRYTQNKTHGDAGTRKKSRRNPGNWISTAVSLSGRQVAEVCAWNRASNAKHICQESSLFTQHSYFHIYVLFSCNLSSGVPGAKLQVNPDRSACLVREGGGGK